MHPACQRAFMFLLLSCCAMNLSCAEESPIKDTLKETEAFNISPAMQKWLGEKRIEILQKAERVESFRIDGMIQPKTDTAGGYKILSQGKPLSKTQSEQLQKLTLSESSYLLDEAKSCEPIPGVVLRVHFKKEFVDVVFCFQCNMWGFLHHDKTIWEDFDPIRPQLVKLMKELFPEDHVVQGLEENS